MPTYTIANAKKNLSGIVDSVQYGYNPVRIQNGNQSAVMVSEEQWRSIEETLYLMSIPGMEQSIIDGMKEKIEDCATELDW